MDRKEFDELRRQLQAFPVRRTVTIGLVVLVVAVLLWLSVSSVYTVAANEVGVVQRFGRYMTPPAEPGLHWKLPFGIDTVQLVKVNRVETLEFGYRTQQIPTRGRTVYGPGAGDTLMLTGDQNIVQVEWIVQFKISDPAPVDPKS